MPDQLNVELTANRLTVASIVIVGLILVGIALKSARLPVRSSNSTPEHPHAGHPSH